eukprot:5359490-Amphidinium_carterae.1
MANVATSTSTAPPAPITACSCLGKNRDYFLVDLRVPTFPQTVRKLGDVSNYGRSHKQHFY